MVSNFHVMNVLTSNEGERRPKRATRFGRLPSKKQVGVAFGFVPEVPLANPCCFMRDQKCQSIEGDFL